MNPTIITAMALALLLLAGCGNQDPGAEDEADHYPSAVGSWWLYEETSLYGDVEQLRYEITGTEQLSSSYFDGERTVLVLENTFPGSPDELRIQYIEDDGVVARRLRHLIWDKDGELTKQRDFIPGFLRFDRDRIVTGDEWTETVRRYTDTMDGEAVQDVTLEYTFTVQAESEQVTVPAGTFDCLKLRRRVIDAGDVEEKIYWFADGVGKVQEETVGDKVEKLADYGVTAP